MNIKIHQFKAHIPRLYKSHLTKLLEILLIPDSKWHKTLHWETQQLKRLNFDYPDIHSAASINLGKRHRDEYTDEIFYDSAGITLHGSFFDRSSFNFGEFLELLHPLGYSPTELDLAFDDDRGVTTEEQWVDVFTNYRRHCIGNMLKRSNARIQTDSGKFHCIQIAAARSANYATLYRRKEGYFRFELKMRTAAQIRPLLLQYDQKTPAEFLTHCKEVLVSNIDIFTPETKDERKASNRQRMPFWEAFLESAPKKVSWKTIRQQEEKLDQDTLDCSRKALKRITGQLNAYRKRFNNCNELVEILKNQLEELSGMPVPLVLLNAQQQ